MLYNTKAIILKTTKLGEADKILTLYSPEHGPIRAVAKGACKAESSFGIKAQVLSYLDLSIAKGRNLDIISQAKLIDDFRNIKLDYDLLTAAYFFVDVIDTVAIEDDHYLEHFDLLLAALNELNKLSGQIKTNLNSLKVNHHDTLRDLNFLTLNDKMKLVTLQFLWELIDQLGYKPELERCNVTHHKKKSDQIAKYFDFKEGSIVSTTGFNRYVESNPYQENIVQIDSGVYKLLQALDQAQDLRLYPSSNFISAVKLLYKHLEHRLAKPIKSWKLLDEVISDSLIAKVV